MSIILCAIQCILVAYLFYTFQFQFSCSLYVRLFATLWTAAHQTSLSITSSQTLLKLMSIKSVKTSNHLILCHPLLLLPSVFPSIRVFFNKSVLHIMWPKYGSFNFSMSPSSEYSGPISCRLTGLISLQSKGLSTLLQHHSSKVINSLALCFLYGSTLTPIHDYRENHSLDKTDLCWQSNVFTF